MPTFAKVSHISFSARDRYKSAQWYKEVLGFEDLEQIDGDGWSAVLLIHPANGVVVEFQQHDGNGGEPFDPARTGFDHLGLMVESREELEAWAERFARLGVRHSPIADEDYGSVLCFRDPDEIQLELFYRKGHP